MEILAPAGNRESLEAAVRSGTDAVYLGASSFNARRNADNFDGFSLREAVRYCHARHVSVYVTLNTLIFDSERDAFIACAKEVAEAGPDWVIVQDLGALKYLRAVCQELPISASTQMAVHNIYGALALEKLGIKQAVLARELSLEEIRMIRKETSLRLETFVHGAHCMSVSGNCYFSQALGERSGNRGLCAQPCRLDFRCNGRPYTLSLKDLSFMEHVKELEEAGVSTLKIEGRMKRPEYVAAAVHAVRTALNGDRPDMDDLRSVFSRSGFTDGYLTAKRNASMFGMRSEADAQATKSVLGKMSDLYRREYQGIPVSFTLSAVDGVLSLEASDGRNTVIKKQPFTEEDTGVLTKEIAQRALSKTGGTPFRTDTVSADLPGSLHIRSSQINEIRRDVLELLLEKGAVGCSYSVCDPIPLLSGRHERTQKLRLRFYKYEQVFVPDGIEMITLPAQEIEAHPEILNAGVPVSAELPVMIWPGMEKKWKDRILRLCEKGLCHVTAGNIGSASVFADLHLIVHGDYTLNIANSDSLASYADLGLNDVILSPEMTIKQAKTIANVIPAGITAYGRLPLMYFRSCPARTDKGCGNCSGNAVVTDNRSAFPVICCDKQYSVMMNSLPLYLGDMELTGPDFLQLYFSLESPDEVRLITELFMKGGKADFQYTRGHANKPVR